ncbi:MAG: hypothetical protein GY699_13920 [Desulfobacteraceae bacterium]|nr:hypothetical protein [Desulfobacteraceae bacterium]
MEFEQMNSDFKSILFVAADSGKNGIHQKRLKIWELIGALYLERSSRLGYKMTF